MLDTTVSDANRYPLKLHDLVVMPIDLETAPVSVVWANGPEQLLEDIESPGLSGDRFYRPMHVSNEWDAYTGSMMFVDPSGRGNDETSYCVVKHLRGKLYLMDVGGFRDGYSMSTLIGIGRTALKHKVNAIEVEPNYGDGMFVELLKPVLSEPNPEYDWPGYRCTVEDAEWATGQKELRVIDTLEPVMNQHRLVVSPELIERDSHVEDPQYSFFYQMTRLSKERGCLAHDDRIEALYGAVKYWVNSMAAEQLRALDDYKARKLDNELRKFRENITDPQHQRYTLQMHSSVNQKQTTWVSQRRR